MASNLLLKLGNLKSIYFFFCFQMRLKLIVGGDGYFGIVPTVSANVMLLVQIQTDIGH